MKEYTLEEIMDAFEECAKQRENLEQENKLLKEYYCNRTDCIGRIKDSKKYDSVKQQLDKATSILTELEEWLNEKWYEIEPKGTGINFNCEYDSEEDYVRGMETKSKLDTLKNSLNKIQELKEKYK